jgi:hypothetical protein
MPKYLTQANYVGKVQKGLLKEGIKEPLVQARKCVSDGGACR